jgi:hypothetical protein
VATAFDDNYGVLVRIYFNAHTVTQCEVKALRADGETEAEIEALRLTVDCLTRSRTQPE